jgi:hypothetical protein
MTARANDSREGDDYVFTWPDYRIVIVIGEVRDSHGEPYGEVTVYYQDDDGARIHVTGPTRYNLTGPRSRPDMHKIVQGRFDHVEAMDWQNIVEQAFHLTVQQFRRGNPYISLDDGPDEMPYLHFLMDPLLPRGETVMLYADGSSGKSYLAMFCALGLLTRLPLADGRLVPGDQPPLDTLYLDWEGEQNQMRRRWMRACRGLGLPRQPIFYDQPTRPLSQIVSQVRRNLVEMDAKSKAAGRGGVGLVVIDSIGMAIEAEATAAEAATHLFTAARALGRTVLFLHHMSKDAVKGKGPQEAYGTIYFKLAARNTWEMRADDPTLDDKEVGIWQRKTNEGALRREPLVLHMHFDGEHGPVTLTGGRISLASGVDTHRPLGNRLLDALRDGAKTLREVAEMLDLEERQFDTLKSAATRLNKRGLIIKLGEDKWGAVQLGGGFPTTEPDDPMSKEVPW